MDENGKEKKKKEYTFALLRRRPTWQRLDIMSVSAISLGVLSYFGWQLTDKEDLLAMGTLIMAILLNGVLLLNNYWSVSYHETIAYQSLDNGQIDECSHVRVRIDNKKQNVVKRYIVPIIQKTMELTPGNVIVAHQVEVQKKKFSYNKERKTFSQIPYPVQDSIECYQTAEGIADKVSQAKADLVWGPNEMHVPIP